MKADWSRFEGRFRPSTMRAAPEVLSEALDFFRGVRALLSERRVEHIGNEWSPAHHCMVVP
jgi:hypothetical protein